MDGLDESADRFGAKRTATTGRLFLTLQAGYSSIRNSGSACVLSAGSGCLWDSQTRCTGRARKYGHTVHKRLCRILSGQKKEGSRPSSPTSKRIKASRVAPRGPGSGSVAMAGTSGKALMRSPRLRQAHSRNAHGRACTAVSGPFRAPHRPKPRSWDFLSSCSSQVA